MAPAACRCSYEEHCQCYDSVMAAQFSSVIQKSRTQRKEWSGHDNSYFIKLYYLVLTLLID